MTLDTYRNLLIELSLAQLELQLATLRRQTIGGYLRRFFRDDNSEEQIYRSMVADLRQRVTAAGPVESDARAYPGQCETCGESAPYLWPLYGHMVCDACKARMADSAPTRSSAPTLRDVFPEGWFSGKKSDAREEA